MRNRIKVSVALLLALGCSGCGPTARELGEGGMIAAPGLLVAAVLLPMAFDTILKRRSFLTSRSMPLFAVLMGASLLAAMAALFAPTSGGHWELAGLTLAFGSLSMAATGQLGWWLFDRKQRTRFPYWAPMLSFALLVWVPAVFLWLDPAHLSDESAMNIAGGLWVLPGFYGVVPLILLAVNGLWIYRERRIMSAVAKAR